VTLKNRPGVPVPGNPDVPSGDSEVHSITDAATAHSEEMRQRMIKYAVAMGIRMVCLILIFVVDGWFKVLPVIGAVFLPWVAVIIANGGDQAEVHADSLLDYAPLAQLDAPPTPATIVQTVEVQVTVPVVQTVEVPVVQTVQVPVTNIPPEAVG